MYSSAACNHHNVAIWFRVTNLNWQIAFIRGDENTLEIQGERVTKRQKSRGGAMKSQKCQGEGVIKRQKSKGGPIKSLKFLGGLVN